MSGWMDGNVWSVKSRIWSVVSSMSSEVLCVRDVTDCTGLYLEYHTDNRRISKGLRVRSGTTLGL